MPDIENSRKTAERGAEWVTVKQPKNSRENSRNTRKKAVLTVFRVFRLFSRLFFGCFTVTHSAPLSAVFRLFSMSGIWHLCSWPQRSQGESQKPHLKDHLSQLSPYKLEVSMNYKNNSYKRRVAMHSSFPGMDRICLREMSLQPHEWPLKLQNWDCRGL